MQARYGSRATSRSGSSTADSDVPHLRGRLHRLPCCVRAGPASAAEPGPRPHVSQRLPRSALATAGRRPHAACDCGGRGGGRERGDVRGADVVGRLSRRVRGAASPDARHRLAGPRTVVPRPEGPVRRRGRAAAGLVELRVASSTPARHVWRAVERLRHADNASRRESSIPRRSGPGSIGSWLAVALNLRRPRRNPEYRCTTACIFKTTLEGVSTAFVRAYRVSHAALRSVQGRPWPACSGPRP